MIFDDEWLEKCDDERLDERDECSGSECEWECAWPRAKAVVGDKNGSVIEPNNFFHAIYLDRLTSLK